MTANTQPHFLGTAPDSELARQQAESDLAGRGFVMNLTRLWAYQPAAKQMLFDLLNLVSREGGITPRQQMIIVPAVASALGDAYCSIAWGQRLAKEAGAEVAASVIRGDDLGLDPAEQALARWVRSATRHPSHTTPEQVDELRRAGFTDAQIFALTAFAALRVAFSTINGSLGAGPDAAFASTAPEEVRHAVTYGRELQSA